METPSLALKLFVCFAWGMSCISMLVALSVRTSKKFTHWLEKFSLSPWPFATTVLAIGAFLLIYSQELTGIVKYDGKTPLIDSVLNTIRVFGARPIPAIQGDVLAKYLPPSLCQPYEITHSLARLAAPVDTLMGIFILISSVISSPRLRLLSLGRDAYIFSNLNEHSLLMATSIMNHYENGSFHGESRKCLIAFTGTGASATNFNTKVDSLMEEALSKQMICIGGAITPAIDCVSSTGNRRVFIISGKNEMTNIQDGLTFIKKLTEHEQKHKGKKPIRKPEVFIVSASPTADTFIDAATASAIPSDGPGSAPLVSVRRIDRMRSTIETFLWNYPLFLVEKPSKNDIPTNDDLLYTKTDRRIAIIGSGSISCEFLKAAIWCAQIDGINYAIDIIDKGANQVKSRFAMDAPEILHLSDEAPEAEYHVNFLSINTEGGEYLDYLKSHRNELTYLVIALDDNLLNVKVARRTREILEQGRYSSGKTTACVERPLICTITTDKKLADIISKMSTSKNAPYDIVPIGINADTYSYENLFMPDIDLIGRNVNRAYWGYYDLDDRQSDEAIQLRQSADASYEKSEYNRRSSRATAIHLKYNLFAYLRRRMLAADDPSNVPAISTAQWQGELANFQAQGSGTVALATLVDEFQNYVDNSSWEELRWLSAMEHDRWSAYLRSEAYEVADAETFSTFFEETKENQNRLSRQHVCLVPFDSLQEASDFVFARSHKSSDQDYERLDAEIVLHLKDIAEDRER